MKKTKKNLALIILCASISMVQASDYHVTNDLPDTYWVSRWTNSAGTNIILSTTTFTPGYIVWYNLDTNGNAGLGIQSTNTTVAVLIPWTYLPFSGGNLSTMFAIAMQQVAPASETIPQTQLALKSFFITGAHPSQANYWELIDTTFYYINWCYTNAQNAANAASNSTALFQNQPYRASATVDIFNTATPYVSYVTGWGLTNISAAYSAPDGARTFTITNYFSPPMEDVNYAVEGSSANPGSILSFTTVSTATNKCVFKVVSSTDTNWCRYYFKR